MCKTYYISVPISINTGKPSSTYLGGFGPHKTLMQFLNIDPWLYGLKLSWFLLDENEPLIWKRNQSNILHMFTGIESTVFSDYAITML